jgi:hypothetical protein
MGSTQCSELLDQQAYLAARAEVVAQCRLENGEPTVGRAPRVLPDRQTPFELWGRGDFTRLIASDQSNAHRHLDARFRADEPPPPSDDERSWLNGELGSWRLEDRI